MRKLIHTLTCSSFVLPAEALFKGLAVVLFGDEVVNLRPNCLRREPKFLNVLSHSGRMFMTFAGQSQADAMGLKCKKPQDIFTGGPISSKHW